MASMDAAQPWWRPFWGGERAMRSQLAVAAANAEARGRSAHHDLVERPAPAPTQARLRTLRSTYLAAAAVDLLVGVVWLVAAFRHQVADDVFLIAGAGWTIRSGYELWRARTLHQALRRRTT